jgi:hypothetical protein
MKELEKYIKNGITITGNPEKGYSVFTIHTQHFDIKTLDELTPEKFEHEIEKQQSYDEIFKDSIGHIPSVIFNKYLKD